MRGWPRVEAHPLTQSAQRAELHLACRPSRLADAGADKRGRRPTTWKPTCRPRPAASDPQRTQQRSSGRRPSASSARSCSNVRSTGSTRLARRDQGAGRTARSRRAAWHVRPGPPPSGARRSKQLEQDSSRGRSGPDRPAARRRIAQQPWPDRAGPWSRGPAEVHLVTRSCWLKRSSVPEKRLTLRRAPLAMAVRRPESGTNRWRIRSDSPKSTARRISASVWMLFTNGI